MDGLRCPASFVISANLRLGLSSLLLSLKWCIKGHELKSSDVKLAWDMVLRKWGAEATDVEDFGMFTVSC